MQVGVVVLPVGDLALQCRIDAACAGCNDLCGLVPKLILSGYAFVCRAVRLVVGLHKGVDLLLNTGDDRLELASLCSSLLGRAGAFVHGGGQILDRLFREGDLRLSIGNGVCVLLHRLVVILDGLLSRPYLVVGVVDGVLQVVVFLREKSGRIGVIAVLVVIGIRLLLRVCP